MEASGEDSPPLPLQAVKAELLEKLSRFDDAIEAWEVIEARDPSFRNAAERVAELRAKQAPAAAPADAQAESRYEILEELGRGAMGVVYKARDKHLGRIVALKRLTENLRGHPTAIAFFEREARAAAALNHPNIVTVYDAGSESGHYFITMEFLQGTTLDSILRARGAMAAPIVAAIAMQVCAGLHYAHTARIVHRDIKTANLFYTRERIVKIMDFGLAKMVEEVRKGATVIGGTPFYMAPEQAAGEIGRPPRRPVCARCHPVRALDQERAVPRGRRELPPPQHARARPARAQARDPRGDGPAGDEADGQAARGALPERGRSCKRAPADRGVGLGKGPSGSARIRPCRTSISSCATLPSSTAPARPLSRATWGFAATASPRSARSRRAARASSTRAV